MTSRRVGVPYWLSVWSVCPDYAPDIEREKHQYRNDAALARSHEAFNRSVAWENELRERVQAELEEIARG